MCVIAYSTYLVTLFRYHNRLDTYLYADSVEFFRLLFVFGVTFCEFWLLFADVHWKAVAAALRHWQEAAELLAHLLLLLDALLFVSTCPDLQVVYTFLLVEDRRILLEHLVELEDTSLLSNWDHHEQIDSLGKLHFYFLTDGVIIDILDRYV